MEDWTMKRPIGLLHYELVKVESLIFLADFFILDFEVNFGVPIIFELRFYKFSRAKVRSS